MFLNIFVLTNDVHTHFSLISYWKFQPMLSIDSGVIWNAVTAVSHAFFSDQVAHI